MVTPLFQTTTASKVGSAHEAWQQVCIAKGCTDAGGCMPAAVQVTSDFLERLRQMKARMTALKTKVETVRRRLRYLGHAPLLRGGHAPPLHHCVAGPRLRRCWRSSWRTRTTCWT